MITKPTETSLRVERTFDASPEDVFDAWTNPEVLRRWWRPNPAWSTPSPRSTCAWAGAIASRWKIPRTDQAPAGGEYSEVSRPRRLVYSWQWEQDDGRLGHASTVTVDFRADGELTTVLLEHSGLISAESRDSHTHGWAGILEMLQAHAARECGAHVLKHCRSSIPNRDKEQRYGELPTGIHRRQHG